MQYVWKNSEIVDAWMIDIEEIRYQGNYPDWIGKLILQGRLTQHYIPHVIELKATPNGTMTAHHGDYIIKDSKGAFWTCRSGSFNENYKLWAGDYEYDTDNPVAAESVKSFIVESIVDHPDGSATINVDMDMDTLKIFASIGLKKVLIDYAEKIIEEDG